MITEDNWINFIKVFFGVEGASNEWVHHVAVGWNYNKNEPGCNCSFKWYSGAEECEIYIGVREAKEQYKLAMASDGEIVSPEPPTEINVEGVGTFLERGSDDDFYEPDEKLEDVKAAWSGGEHGFTAPTVASVDADDYLSALQPSNDDTIVEQFEDTQTLPTVTDTGAHPKLKTLVAEYMETHQNELTSGDTQTLPSYTEADTKATTEFMEAIDTSEDEESDEDNNK